MALVWAWVTLGAVLALVLFLSIVIVKYYSDPHDAHPLSTTMAVISLTAVLLCVAALPIDVYLVSSAVDAATGKALLTAEQIAQQENDMQIVYYVLYGLVLLNTFLLLPFAYFFYEEDDEDATTQQRMLGAIKYTVAFVVAAVIIIVIGLVLRPSNTKNGTWIDRYFDAQDGGKQAIQFTISCLILIGCIGWILYAGYGMAALPIGMIKGKRNIKQETLLAKQDLALMREKRRALEYKYSLRGSGEMNKKEKKEFERVKREERRLHQMEGSFHAKEDSIWHRMSVCCAPFRMVFGWLFLAWAVFLAVSLLLGVIDKFMNSECGASCGYLVEKSTLPSPVDLLLIATHVAFPVDYIVLSLVLLYLIFATLNGIVRMGIRFIWMLLYRIRVRRTVPQGVLLLTMIFNFLLLTMNNQMLTLAPQYSTFGTQTYVDPSSGKVEPCTVVQVGLGAAAHNGTSVAISCTPTRFASMMNTSGVQMPFFSVVFFYQNVALLAVFLIGSVVAGFRARPSNVINEDSDDEESV